MKPKKDDVPLSDTEIAARMERAIKKSFTMPPAPRPKKRKQSAKKAAKPRG